MNNNNFKDKALENNNSSNVNNESKASFFLDKGVKESKKTLSPYDVIIILLRERGMKQVDLADLIGLSRQGLNNYIRGRWAVPISIKLKIAQALQVDSAVIWDLGK